MIDVAYESGFGDLANFHHTFRAELGATPAVPPDARCGR
ncbi:MAG: hypothetical protein R2862_02660 [Thermoanaerobaculia bacterium]